MVLNQFSNVKAGELEPKSTTDLLLRFDDLWTNIYYNVSVLVYEH
jgi:hypothetical protein